MRCAFRVQPQEIHILSDHNPSRVRCECKMLPIPVPVKAASAVVVTSIPRFRNASASAGGICSSRWKVTGNDQDASFNCSCFNFASNLEGLLRKDSSAYS